ncbi:MAG: DUF6198 family protein [Butyrivibrio sp.]|nr:DUF6198 family protein [Butyrivibrio sp.]
MKRLKICSEAVYIIAMLCISFAVAMVSAADFGVSMIVASAYVISEKASFLSFGQAEYIVQGLLFIVFCILMRRVRLAYFCAFVTSVLYGALLDMWRAVIPHFNPSRFAPGSMQTAVRIAYLVLGMLMTAFAVALFFKTYICPQVYDYFVKAVSEKYGVKRTRFKLCFDIGCLVTACALSFAFFGRLVGIGIGTVLMTLFNGALIGAFGRLLDKTVEVKPLFPKLAARFEESIV